MRRPWVVPGLLLALAAAVAVGAFVYVSDVNEDVDRKDEAAQILSRMETSTARLGNLAALGSEPSLMLQAAGDAFALQATLDEQLRRWDRAWDGPTPPAVAQLRDAERELTRRLRLAVGGNPGAGRATSAELAQGNRLYHRVADLRAQVSKDAADANAAGDTKTAVVTGIALAFVIILLLLFQFGRVRLTRMRRSTAMREALHEATRESEERYRYVTDLVPDQIFTIGPDGRYDYMNERTATFLGRGRDEVHERWLDLHHPDDTLHVQTTWSNALHSGEPVEVESRMLGADGEYHWILTRAIPQHGEDGAIVRWFCSGTDITGRQRQEQELREARQRLAEAQSIAHIGSWEWDLEEDEMRWSHELQQLFGVPLESRVGYEAFLNLMHPDDRERVEEVLGAAIGERRSYEFEARMIRPDGEERVFFSRGRVLTTDDGTPSRLVGVAQDVTDRVEAERARDRLEAELHQAQRLDSIGQLAGGVAHDFNNLLAVILNYANLVKGQVSDPQLQDDVAEIERAAERAARLTRQLLMFGSRAVAQPEVLDMNELIHEMANLLRSTVGDGVEVELRLAGDLWPLRADRGQLEQVIINLALNARDAMQTAGGVLRIETWNVAGRGGTPPHVRLVVRDSGTGMTPEIEARAFEPFFSTKPAGEGTGLGLATVYGFVKAVGGDLTVDTEPGRGTTITIELPAVPRTTPASDADGLLPTGTRILLVDDEEPVRRVAARMLARNGYDVVTPETPAAALALVSDEAHGNFSLLVTDIVMPDISGSDLAERARAIQPGLKVLFMSGYSGGAQEARDESFLPKPFDEETLLDKVRETLSEGSVTA